jgi:hypothetical protein
MRRFIDKEQALGLNDILHALQTAFQLDQFRGPHIVELAIPFTVVATDTHASVVIQGLAKSHEQILFALLHVSVSFCRR